MSEAHAVQLYGEAVNNIRMLEATRGRVQMRDGKTLEEWRAVVDDLWLNNPGLDEGRIETAVQAFRKIYDELFQQMNKEKVSNVQKWRVCVDFPGDEEHHLTSLSAVMNDTQFEKVELAWKFDVKTGTVCLVSRTAGAL